MNKRCYRYRAGIHPAALSFADNCASNRVADGSITDPVSKMSDVDETLKMLPDDIDLR